MEPEVYFLKYAFPCMEWKMQKGQITEDQFREYKEAALKNEKLSREFLESNYPIPFQVMRDISKEIKKDIWGLETIANYFLIQHNKIIDEKKYGYGEMPALDELCKIYKAKVIRFIDLGKEKMAIVSYHNSQRKRLVDIALVPHIKKGEWVTIHQNYAIESLSDKTSLASQYADKIE